jgi:transposase
LNNSVSYPSGTAATQPSGKGPPSVVELFTPKLITVLREGYGLGDLRADVISGLAIVALADRGYDADWIRELARQQGAWANIPPKRNRKDPIYFSPYLYRASH